MKFQIENIHSVLKSKVFKAKYIFKEPIMAKNGLKSLNLLLKIILVILYDIYGILRRLTSGKAVPIIVGIIQLFTANLFGIFWLIDLITVLLKKDVTVCA